ncbi:mitochondrial dicarboxylate carrier [Scaptodrosophila lebanonensis]|uniref:Mitochondrial dicarboxylate carrier n=1 Tax=Drosophila lebanonensis TaxID=7225 RepID=A0A6J2UH66_DROLE|nr:mitochondrial dicarboxylate carrier [Scaptodrosophila lebanonensis]
MMAVKKDKTMMQTLQHAVKHHGYFSLYDGLSAQLLRQLSYTSVRFHLYETGKRYVDEYNFLHKMFIASIAGLVAGAVGIPSEMVNTRMHMDRMLPHEDRRRYKHVFHGFYKVCQKEGCGALYNGWSYACVRAALLTIGQNAVYDQAKNYYMKTFNFKHHSKTVHLLSSITAALACIPIVQPIEVLKTLNMQVKAGYFKSVGEEVKYMMRFGIRGLFRGIVPGLLRMLPNTVVIFLIYEQLRLTFGYTLNEKKCSFE